MNPSLTQIKKVLGGDAAIEERERNEELPRHYPKDHESTSGENGMKPYIFSTDLLPVKYDRNSQSDMPMKIIVSVELLINVVMVIVFVTYLLKGFENNWFGIMQYAITCAVFVFTLFWLNYKLHVVFVAIYRLLLDFKVTLRNDKYYSGLEIPDFYLQSEEYPHVTIQIPVYKEDLNQVLKPTLLNCCREADRYMDETGAFCNIVVCDDGYNCISDKEKAERLEFYKEIGVGFTARPHPSKYPRNGRFKKAGNLNFSMNYSESFMNGEDITSEQRQYKDVLVALGACYGGDVSYGAYILLIDSDTRLPIIPVKENGCLKRLAKEMMFDGQNVLFIQCYTGPYMSVKSSSEKCIFHHTCNIYNSILIATAIRSMAPLVGHNAFLNFKAMTECAKPDRKTGYLHFWAEDRISEDFNLMMRGCKNGYTGRYASHAGIFLEGVSFSYMTEYFKISKFACGAAELIYNPISQWLCRGIVSEDLIGFVTSSEVEWYNKVYIVSYVFNFMALAVAHFGLLFNLLFCDFLFKVLPLALMPVNLMWESIAVWTVLGGLLAYLFGLRLGFDKWLLFKQVVREAGFLTCLYGSISVRFSLMSFTHLFGWNLSFGATAKDDEKITLMDWIKSTPVECTVYTLYALIMVARILFFTAPEDIGFVVYFGCTPLLYSIALFWLGPLIWDVLPHKSDKTKQESYIQDDLMFTDKYMTQLPNSPVVQKMKKIGLTNMKGNIPSMFKSRAHSVHTIASEDSGIWTPNTDIMSPAQSEKSNKALQSKADKKLREVQSQVAMLESKLAKLTMISELNEQQQKQSNESINKNNINATNISNKDSTPSTVVTHDTPYSSRHNQRQQQHHQQQQPYSATNNNDDDAKENDDCHDSNEDAKSAYFFTDLSISENNDRNDLASICSVSDGNTSALSLTTMDNSNPTPPTAASVATTTTTPNSKQEVLARLKQQYKVKKQLEQALATTPAVAPVVRR